MSSLNNRFDSLQKREKILLIGIMLIVVYAVAEFLLLKPASDRHSQLLSQLEQNRTALASSQEQMAKLQTNSLNSHQAAQLNALNQQLDLLRGELSTLTNGLVDAQKLPRILEDVLIKTGKLELQELHALPVEELQLSHTGQSGEALSTGVFKHAVAVQLKGRYFDAVAYLQALEQLPWGLRWEQLNYRIDSYPNAEITLTVYTLTTEEGLFGEQ